MPILAALGDTCRTLVQTAPPLRLSEIIAYDTLVIIRVIVPTTALVVSDV